MMRAEIVTVGTELLLGQIVDTNSAYISQKLAEIGVNVFFKTACGDNWDRIAQALKVALERSDVVIMTGGLGPTQDDLTKEVVASVFGRKLLMHEESRRRLSEYFASRGRPLTDSVLKQALIPEGGVAIPNVNGTAPGVLVEDGGRAVICMPGVPWEMKAMMENFVLGYLKARSGRGGGVIKSRVLRIFGLGESRVEELVVDIIRSQKNPTVAPLVSMGEVTLRITARAQTPEEALDMIAPVEAAIRDRLGDFVYGADDDTLESVVARLLRERGRTLALAESCTGGLIAHKLTNIPGSSEFFLLGAVTYSNESKERVLGVPEATIRDFGAVSYNTAIQMAAGARRISGADIGLAITGIAGPTGATPNKPVGLVYTALASGTTMWATRSIFSGERFLVKERASRAALDMLRVYLLKR